MQPPPPPEEDKSVPNLKGNVNTWSDRELQDKHQQALEEKEAPKQGFPLFPIILIFITAGLIFWGGVYLAHNSARFDGMAYDPKPPSSEVVELSPEELLAKTISRGEKVFARNCTQCHQANGQGVAGVFPPIANSSWVRGNPERPIAIVIGGLAGKITVLGKEYNNVMAGLGQLSDKDIAAVLTYIRKNEAWGHNETEVTPQEVAKVRAEWGTRTTSWDAAELLERYPLGL